MTCFLHEKRHNRVAPKAILGKPALVAGAVADADADPFERPIPTHSFDTSNGPLSGSRGEVVGSTGRIGSLLLRSGGGLLAASPRGVSPGSLSPPGTPIFVAVPASAVAEVVRLTVPGRMRDLVLIANGLPSRLVGEGLEIQKLAEDGLTVAVPHFGVLRVGGDVVTSASSPPTIVSGRHSASLRILLEKQWGVQMEEAESMEQVEVSAVKKLLWSSLLWLLCHEDENPIDVTTVHDTKSPKLRELVQELLPTANLLAEGDVGTEEEIMEYLESYSRSMPEAVPNKKLAIEEISGRNALFLQAGTDQPLHEELVKRIAGEIVIEKSCSKLPQGLKTSNLTPLSVPHVVLPTVAFVARSNESRLSSQPNVSTAIVVGAGFIGSSVALGLARRGINVTVIDRRNLDEGDPGEATAASWAWINANDKTPLDYFTLNSVGMAMWRDDPALKHLPVWRGSLVRRNLAEVGAETHNGAQDGAYYCTGPLDRESVLELEPTAQFLSLEDSTSEEQRGAVFFYPDEGHVDPIDAVQVLREEATKFGVSFIGNLDVTAIDLDESGHAQSVRLEDGSVMEADVIVAAAGIELASDKFGSVPMLKQPGAIAFAHRNVQPDLGRRDTDSLHRILVDTLNKSHVLQRRDGQLVVGGGHLQVGGIQSVANSKRLQNTDYGTATEAGAELMKAACRVAPAALVGAKLAYTKEADRPIPEDGYPAIGFDRSGCYTVVTHSGITLGPLLGELVGGEISQGIRYDLLENFRPTRFSIANRSIRGD